LGEKVDKPLEGPLVAVDPEEVDLKISLAKNPLKLLKKKYQNDFQFGRIFSKQQ
jgi:hypothetical protein